jgi:two-component system, NarL family, nitrate/nitrite response regulator NarP
MPDLQSPLRIIVLDRSPIFVEGLRALCARHPQVQMRRSAATVDSAITAVMTEKPDILVVSAHLAIPDAVQVARRCHDVSPATRLLFMADSDEFATVVSRSKAIASVFIVSRLIEPEKLIWVLQTLSEGKSLPAAIPIRQPVSKPSESTPEQDDIQAKLTQRELEITRLVAQGLSNKSIADVFHIQQGTVKVHVSNIFRKLGVRSRIGLLRILDLG